MDTINAKSAIDSVNANPIIALEKSSWLVSGFLAMEDISVEKIFPIPMPTPIKANIESPAPIILAASNSIIILPV